MSMMPSAQRRTRFPVLEVMGIGLILLATMLMVGQLSQFSARRQSLPTSLTMAGVPVGGLDRPEAQAMIEQVYGTPIVVRYRDQEIHLDPAEVGFEVDSETMLSQASERGSEGTFWTGFWDYLWLRAEQGTSVDLVADYNEELLRAWLMNVATRYDSPPRPAQPVLETLSFAHGQPGYTLDVEKSIEVVAESLFRPTDRTAELVVEETDASRPGLNTLETLLIQYVDSSDFNGVVSVYIMDLETGDEIGMDVDFRSGNPTSLDCEVPYASTSTMKLAIMVDFFRYLDWEPSERSDDYKNLFETMTQSGNASANAMLFKIGDEDLYDGARSVTELAQAVGMANTFVVAPYDDEEDPAYFSTPAREAVRAGGCVDTAADSYMQTTVKDLALLLDLVYQCAEYGGGGLIALYPDEITQNECKMMLELTAQNDEGVLIMAGVPDSVEVAHKHGWTTDTHGDAGIVFSPGSNYVLTLFLWAETEWLPAATSFPIIEGISEATFNYFNPDMVSVPRRGLSEEAGFDG